MLFKAYTLSKGNPIQDTKEILADIKKFVTDQGATFECMGFGATGYAAQVLEESVKADVNIVETIAHMMSAIRFVPDADVVCDIGGQDIKVLFLSENREGTRDVRDFRLSNQCSAGNGMLLQAMADQFGVHLHDYADVAFEAPLAPKFSYGCAVFLAHFDLRKVFHHLLDLLSSIYDCPRVLEHFRLLDCICRQTRC